MPKEIQVATLTFAAADAIKDELRKQKIVHLVIEDSDWCDAMLERATVGYKVRPLIEKVEKLMKVLEFTVPTKDTKPGPELRDGDVSCSIRLGEKVYNKGTSIYKGASVKPQSEIEIEFLMLYRGLIARLKKEGILK